MSNYSDSFHIKTVVAAVATTAVAIALVLTTPLTVNIFGVDLQPPTVLAQNNTINNTSVTWTIKLQETNNEPSAQINAPNTAFTNKPVEFDGSGSSDPEDDTDDLTFDWTLQGVGKLNTSSNNQKAYKSFPKTGTYDVALKVTDTGGLSDKTIHQITIGALPSFDIDPKQQTVWVVANAANRSAQAQIEFTNVDSSINLDNISLNITGTSAGISSGDISITKPNANTREITLKESARLDPGEYEVKLKATANPSGTTVTETATVIFRAQTVGEF